MKICPKCHSSYTDETLNFCLTDGVPLVVEEALGENQWHDAETLVDNRISKLVDTQRTSAPTAPQIQADTSVYQNQKRANLFPIYGAILILLIGGGVIWWFTGRQNSSTVSQMSSGENKSTVATPTRVVVQLSAEQETAVKREVTDFLNGWRESNEQKDIDAHLKHYADTLQIYYGESNKDKGVVRTDRERAYRIYDTLAFQLDKVKITPESTESATVLFDKSWTMKNQKKTSTGSVQQEIHVTKTGGKWLIDSERDLKVYFLNNRENQEENVNKNAL